MTRWWEFEPETKYPWIPLRREAEGEWRLELSLVLWFVAVIAMLAGLGALVLGAIKVWYWGTGISCAAVGLAWLVGPSEKPKR